MSGDSSSSTLLRFRIPVRRYNALTVFDCEALAREILEANLALVRESTRNGGTLVPRPTIAADFGTPEGFGLDSDMPSSDEKCMLPLVLKTGRFPISKFHRLKEN